MRDRKGDVCGRQEDISRWTPRGRQLNGTYIRLGSFHMRQRLGVVVSKLARLGYVQRDTIKPLGQACVRHPSSLDEATSISVFFFFFLSLPLQAISSLEVQGSP